MLYFSYCIFFVLSFSRECFSANILIADNLPTPSHQIWNFAISEELVARGHNVTMLAPSTIKPMIHRNYHHLDLENMYTVIMKDFDPNAVVTNTILDEMFFYYDYSIEACRHSFQTNGFKTLMNYPKEFKFDLIIFDITLCNCFLPLIQRFKYPPAIGITAFLLPHFLSLQFGNDIQPAYLPTFYTGYENEMNFFQRLVNYFCHYGDIFLRTVYMDRHLNSLMSEAFGTNMDRLSNLENHLSLLLTNLDPVLNQPQPITPNIIQVAGLHIKPEKLTKELQKIMDSASNGVILFALGTNVKSMDLDKKQVIIDAFSKLKETVLWKFEANITGLPKNVIVREWVPQSDILAHPNLKLFISHAGALSTLEAAYHGVPILGIPFFVDQHANIDNIIHKGIGRKLSYDSLTTENFLENINELLHTDKYSQNMKLLSRRMRDQPQTPLERAMFWIEYVIRNNGSLFLSPKSRSLPLFITSCTDIHLFFLGILCFLFYILYLTHKIIIDVRNTKTKKD